MRSMARPGASSGVPRKAMAASACRRRPPSSSTTGRPTAPLSTSTTRAPRLSPPCLRGPRPLDHDARRRLILELAARDELPDRSRAALRLLPEHGVAALRHDDQLGPYDQ